LRWDKALTGLSALAAEIVLLSICVSVPFFDLRFSGATVGFPPPPPKVDCCDDTTEIDAEATDGFELSGSTKMGARAKGRWGPSLSPVD
jgi:hypothetical protein